MTKQTAILFASVFVSIGLWSACGSSTPSSTPSAPSSLVPTDPPGFTAPPPGNPTPVPTPGPNPTPPPTSEIPIGSGTATLTAVGDIGWCGSSGVGLTGRLLQSLSGGVLLLGDIAYMRGRMDDFRNCFDPEYGRFRSRWRPVPGNHEYEDPGASGYFTYFGDSAGASRTGYYSFEAAAWRILMLNSNMPASNGSPQFLWVRDELSRNRTRCTMAVWHHPYVSSGPNGPTAYMRDMWTLLQEWNVEMVVAGHDHFYERFGPQTATYEANEKGIRQFIAGTGGAPLYRPVSRFPNSEVIVEAWGVLKFNLFPTSYDWEFVNANNNAIADRGVGQCH